MPIAALSDATSSIISSSVVLNDAISATKELLDNALDSRATNIVIEISANTLDIIQVKDNGAGIGIEDRQLLCKRSYTSKIRNLEDLAILGGSSLGFRGEALASIAELSDSLTFITRVEGEAAGSLLKFNSERKLTSSSSASHSTGTTVRISDFLKCLPVRQQAVRTKASKLLTDLKCLLFQYAFARPTTRFQMKVLKSKSDFKANWSYAPSPDAVDLRLLASKILGKECVKHCTHENIASEDQKYIINALFLSHMPERGLSFDQYISLDGRPLNPDGVLMKGINEIYKKYIRVILGEHATLPRKPFLVVQLSCPPDSYDVNVEPAKDEVLFDNEQLIKALFEDLCKRVYGEVEQTDNHVKSRKFEKAPSRQSTFDLLLAKKPRGVSTSGEEVRPSEMEDGQIQVENMVATPRDNDGRQPMLTSPPNTTLPSHDPITRLGHATDTIAPRALAIDDEDGELIDLQTSNPFVLAKLSTRVARPHVQNQAGRLSQDSLERSITAKIPLDAELPETPSIGCVKEPGYDPSVNGSDALPIVPAMRSGTATLSRTPNDSSSVNQRIQRRQSELPISPVTHSWAQSIPSPPATSPLSSSTVSSQRFQPTVMSGPRTSCSPRSSAHLYSQPFRTPFKTKISEDASPQIRQRHCYTEPNLVLGRSPISSITSTTLSRPAPDDEREDELEDIMEFEHRKRQHILQHRAKAASNGTGTMQPITSRQKESSTEVNEGKDVPSIISSKALYEARFNSEGVANDGGIPQSKQAIKATCNQVPHSARVAAEIEGCQSTSRLDATGKEPGDLLNTQINPNDPRAYLIRQISHKAEGFPQNRLSRSKPSRMPFETILPGSETYSTRAFLTTEVYLDIVSLGKHDALRRKIDGLYNNVETSPADMVEMRLGKENLEMCKIIALQMADRELKRPDLEDGVR